MTCEEFHELWVVRDLELDEYTTAERSSMARHVHGCPTCQKVVDDAVKEETQKYPDEKLTEADDAEIKALILKDNADPEGGYGLR
jgi:hypothetical protein